MTDGMWVTTGEYDEKKPTVWAINPGQSALLFVYLKKEIFI